MSPVEEATPMAAFNLPQPHPSLTVDTPPSGGGGCHYSSLDEDYDGVEIHKRLTACLQDLLPQRSAVDIGQECLDLFMQYMFPNTPIIHEPTMRANISLLLPENHTLFPNQPAASPKRLDQLSCYRAFTAITALSAHVVAALPASFVPHQDTIATTFLETSRRMLRLYLVDDVDHPDSSSLMIRFWHAAAVQNTTGKASIAWHIHGEATMLALRLRLYDEAVVCMNPPIESKLLRANFWLLYLADQSAIALDTRISLLREPMFSGGLSLLERDDKDVPLLDMNKKINQGAFESQISTGFHLKQRVWSSAAAVLANIPTYSSRKKNVFDTQQGDQERAELELHLTESYIRFSAVLDDLPASLRYPDDIGGSDKEVALYQKTSFWTLRSNIMTTYYCVKLVILQSCLQHNVPEVLGLNNSSLAGEIKKVEITQDFLHELQIVPYMCFKAQGEAAVERIRRVGSILLELSQNAENDTIRQRAQSQFSKLLHMLAILDSKASDELGEAEIPGGHPTYRQDS
ncbi:unnamed protein product [Penicillium crustosum]